MTLISNEIFLDKGVEDPVIICYADRQITYPKESDPAKKYIDAQKLFRIEYLNATVSFFGTTAIQDHLNPQKLELLSTWLPDFILRNENKHSSLIDFAQTLREELNKKIHKQDMMTFDSGFHLAGIRSNGIPEFIHFSNCTYSRRKKVYIDRRPEYSAPTEDFLNEHAIEYGWDGFNPESFKKITTQNQSYYNGDIRGHLAAWEMHTHMFRRFFKYADFKKPSRDSDDDIRKLFNQKLSIISQFYSNWADTKWVGDKWDIEILRKV